MRRKAMSRLAFMILLAALGQGCFTVYQPLVGLQRPVAIDPETANFAGLRLRVRCLPNDALSAAELDVLCQRVSALFSNQGAEVDTVTERGGLSDELDGTARKPDLVVDLKARVLQQERNALLWMLSSMTMTLMPMVEEYVFAQDVTIRDAEGFLLVSDSLQGRFVRYIGAGIWSVNWLLDVIAREEADELTGDAAQRDFSRDFYTQLSQLTFNARGRWLVLRPASVPAPIGDAAGTE